MCRIRKYCRLFAGLALGCIILLSACGKEKEPMYGYLPVFVNIPDIVLNDVNVYGMTEESIYTLENQRGAICSRYDMETGEPQELFILPADEYPLGIGIDENRQLLVLISRYMGEECSGKSVSVLKSYTLAGETEWEIELEGYEKGYRNRIYEAESGQIVVSTDKYLFVVSADRQQVRRAEYPFEGPEGYANPDVIASDGNSIYLVRLKEYQTDGGLYELLLWEEDTGSLEKVGSFTKVWPLQMVFGEGIYMAEGEYVYRYDPRSEKREAIFSQEENMLYAQKIDALLQEEKGWQILCRNMNDGLRMQVVRLEWGPQNKVTQLSLAAINTNLYSSSVILFNQRHPEYLLKMRTYGAEDTDARLEQIQLSLVSKDAPDLLEIWDMDRYINYAGKGWLQDLIPYMENSKAVQPEDYIPSVLEAMMLNGKLYVLPDSFEVHTLALPESVMGKCTNWTIEEFLDFMEEYPDAYFVMRNDLPDQAARKKYILNIALERGLEGFVDAEQGTVELDGERFRELLVRINELPVNENAGLSYEDLKHRVEEGEILLCDTMVGDISSISWMEEALQEEVVLIGYPTAERKAGGGVFSIAWPLGISGNSGQKDAAWTFLEELALRETEAGQLNYGLPARQAELEKLLKEAQNKDLFYAGTDEEGNYIYTGLSQRHVDMIWSATETSVAEDPVMKALQKIILEEVSDYFTGKKTLDEVIDIMQNRVNLYWIENHNND